MGPSKRNLSRLGEEFLRAKCDFFLDVQLWPTKTRLNPERWLTNFLPAEKEHAFHLLHAFQYFSDAIASQLFSAALQDLSTMVCAPTDSFLVAQSTWRDFVGRAIITYVEDEEPNASDSGFTFARRAKKIVGFPESRIAHPGQAIELLLAASSPPPIVFVDDFVGSGNQCRTTWVRDRTLSTGVTTSFAAIAQKIAGSRFIYCPLLCTTIGQTAISTACKEIILKPVHTLTSRDGVFAADSHVWPDHLRPTAEAFIEQASLRVGIDDWRGYSGLGLTVAFQDVIPDATLPLFSWNQNGWHPILEFS